MRLAPEVGFGEIGSVRLAPEVGFSEICSAEFGLNEIPLISGHFSCNDTQLNKFLPCLSACHAAILAYYSEN
jgi:hypothetical protein